MSKPEPKHIHFLIAEENLAVVPSHLERGADTVRPEGTLPVMKQVRDLPLWPIWVNPEHLVRTALVLMRGHGVAGLGVIEGKEFVGVVYIEDLAGVAEDTPVFDYVRKEVESVTPSTSLRRVAEMMVGRNLPRMPVLDEGRFLGIVSAHDLLKDVGRNYDPLTQLPWSDALREWGVRNLEAGQEVTILFFDLDEFGQFNKRFGHLVGDQVLRRVADELRSNVATTTDLLCRYGGDEFVIGTLRSRAETDYLAEEIVRRIDGLELEGVSIPVTISHGVFGGRRTKEREGTHFAATLDNLINQASKECTARKAMHGPPPEPAPRIDPAEIEIVSVTANSLNGGFRGVAVISTASGFVTGVVESAVSPSRAGASALAAALSQTGDPKFEILDVIESPGQAGKLLTVVGLREGIAVAASGDAAGDPAMVAARLAFEAFCSTT